MSSILLARPTMSSRSSGVTKVSFRWRTISWLSLSPWCSIAWMSRTLFSTPVKSQKSFASASAASRAFWAACAKRTKNSLFLGRSDRRTGVLLWRHILRHRYRRRECPLAQGLTDALGNTCEDLGLGVVTLVRHAGVEAHQASPGA